MESVRDFAVDHPNTLIVATDPATDELLVTYGGKVMYGKFDPGVVARAVTPEGFKSAWQRFADQFMSAIGSDEKQGAKLMNGVLDAIQSIGESLSANNAPHGKDKEGGRGVRSKGGGTRVRTGVKRARTTRADQ